MERMDRRSWAPPRGKKEARPFNLSIVRLRLCEDGGA